MIARVIRNGLRRTGQDSRRDGRGGKTGTRGELGPAELFATG